jgi:[NiFe] hydrogenase assembly HybE family chaperone
MVTPWFMNLTVLPCEADRGSWVKGGAVRVAFPSGLYAFTVGEVPDAGLVATCPLFSSMADFTDHEAAQLAASSAAAALFEPEAPEPAPVVSRRQLLGG